MTNQWTANTAAEALNLLKAAQDRIEASLLAAHPDLQQHQLHKAGREIPLRLDITFDISDLDQLANDRGTFNAQIREMP